MKTLINLTIAILFTSFSYSQSKTLDFSNQKDRINLPEISNEYSEYKVFSSDLRQMKKALSNKNSNIEFKFQDWESIELELSPSDIINEDFKVAVIDEEGRKEYNKALNIETFQGYTAHGKVRLTLSDESVNGFIDTKNGTYFLESIEASGSLDYISVVNEKDRKEAIHKACNHDKHFESAPVPERGGTLNPGQCYQVSLAVAADHLMVADHGGIDNTVFQIISVMNNVQGNYDYDANVNFEHGLEFNLVEMVLSTCDHCDPWTASTNFFDVYSSFDSWKAESGFSSPHHIGQFWTDRDFDFNYVGLAEYNTEKLCDDSRIHILQDFTSNAAFLRTMVAHEMGHNFGAKDLSEEGSIMSGVLFNTDTWDGDAKSRINAEIALQYDCLAVCGSNICDPVEGLEVNNITETSFELSWNALATDNFDVQVTNVETDEIVYSENTNGNFLEITPNEYSICERYLVEISRNCTPTESDKISVHFISPVGQGCADFKVERCIYWLSENIEVEDQSINATDWDWDFGDGSTSSLQSPNHEYADAGNYDLSLAVNQGNHSKEFNNQIRVLPNKALPYLNENGGSFESAEVQWGSESPSGEENLWETGIAQGELNSDSKVWKTGLIGALENKASESYLYSPRFDFTVGDIYTLDFDLSMDVPVCESFVALQLQYSTNNGTSWVRLGSLGDEGENIQNWYNKGKYSACAISKSLFYDQEGWVLNEDNLDVSYDLSFLSGNSEVIFRFAVSTMYNNDVTDVYEGVMIDNFQINSTGAGVVPLSLLYFNGENRDGVNELHWEAAQMINFDAFVLERSSDGEYFDPVVMIPSQGEESMEYFYGDDETDLVINYYRLKMIDKNGEYDYSRVVKIFSEITEEALTMVPNPNTSGRLIIDGVASEQFDQIRIFNYVGQLMIDANFDKELDISKLTTGSYIVNFISENAILEVKKLQVM